MHSRRDSLNNTCSLDRTPIVGSINHLWVKFMGDNSSVAILVDGLTSNSTAAELLSRVQSVQYFPDGRLRGPSFVNTLSLYGQILEGHKTLLQCGILPGVNEMTLTAYGNYH